MKNLSTAVRTALASGQVYIAQLYKFVFASGTIAVNGSSYDIAFGGDTYVKGINLGSVATIEDQPGELQGAKFTMNAAPSDLLSLALDATDQVQGAPVTVRTAILAGEPLVVLDAPIEWAGLCDTMNINEDGQHAVVEVTAESKAVDLLRSYPLTTSNADQQAIYPGDRAYEYIADQQGKPVVWPSKEFFYQ